MRQVFKGQGGVAQAGREGGDVGERRMCLRREQRGLHPVGTEEI